MEKNELLEKIAKAVIDGVPAEAERLANDAIDRGLDPLETLERGLSRGIEVVGDKFGRGELFLTDLIMSSEAMKSALKIIEPRLRKSDRPHGRMGRVVIGTVSGDIHDIGKSIVAAMLSASEFEVNDLGVDVATDRFIQLVKELKPDILGLSALLTVTTPRQRDVVQGLSRQGIRNAVLVMVGGGSVTQSWAEELSADGYAADALEAVDVARKLVKNKGREYVR